MRTLPLAVSLVVALTACSRYESSGLSGAGSMRVEVEVYRGPLSHSPAIQIGELGAVIADTARVVANWTDGAIQYYPQCGLANGKPRQMTYHGCDALLTAIQSGEEVIFSVCEIFPSWVDRVRADPSGYLSDLRNVCLRRYLDKGTLTKGRPNIASNPIAGPGSKTVVVGSTRAQSEPSVEHIEEHRDELARRIASLAADMRSKAFRVANEIIHQVPRDRRARDLLASFGLIFSEYSNQIQSRVSVLHKQFDGIPSDPTLPVAKTLPVSDYLRDASPTDFVHLYDWYDATMGDNGGAAGGLGPKERIRVAERLFADYYWEKINEVHANGQGEVAMAFVKNDLGNWDLKSFSNDPRELLAAYRGVAEAALKAVAKIATNVGTGGVAGTAEAVDKVSRAQELLTLANQVTTGEGDAPAAPPGFAIEDLHERTAQKLVLRRQQLVARANAIAAEIKAAGEDGPGPGRGSEPANATAADLAQAARESRLKELDTSIYRVRGGMRSWDGPLDGCCGSSAGRWALPASRRGDQASAC